MNTVNESCEGIERQPLLGQEEDVAIHSEPDDAPKTRYTPRQWTVLVVLSVIMFFSAMVCSLQAPFFPKEADAKGISPAVYGFVFGVYELVNFIFCPIYGTYMGKIGPKFMLNAGNYVMASCCLLFGFIDRCPPGTPFIALAFAIRIVEALGQAASITATYAIVAFEFPSSIATTFSVIETLFGVGMVVGPSVGGFLYEAGGFLAPFASVGGFLLLTSTIVVLVLPHIEQSTEKTPGFLKLLRIPTVLLTYCVVVAAAFTFSFLQPVLEPYLRPYGLPTYIVSFLFVINGGVYALTAIVWGFLADKYVNPKLLCGIGGLLTVAAFLLIGPVIFIPLNPSLWLVIVALVLHGLGLGGEYVAAFLDCNQSVLKNGFPNNTQTYGMVAGMWASGIALGNFVGPSLAGVLYSAIGFRNACLPNVALHALVVIFNFAYLAYERRAARSSDVSSPG